jgi:hypothetical protein
MIKNMTIRGSIGYAALIFVLAGCGSAAGQAGSGPGASANPSASPSGQRLLAMYRELADCLRHHGVPNLPDPVLNPATGKVELPPGTAKPPPSAMNACKSISDRLPADDKRPPVTAADMVKLRQLAVCMRGHGLSDWPDPNADGAFPLPKRLMDLGKKGMMSQIQACKQFFPGKSISFVAPGGRNG